MSRLTITPNGKGALVHVNGQNGVYLGYVADYEDGKGWRYEAMFDRSWWEKPHFVGRKSTGLRAIRRRWAAFMDRAGLQYTPASKD